MLKVLDFHFSTKFGSQAKVKENGGTVVYKPTDRNLKLVGIHLCETGKSVFSSGEGKFQIVVVEVVPTVKVGDEIEVIFSYEKDNLSGKSIWIGKASSQGVTYQVYTSDKPYMGNAPHSVKPRWMVKVTALSPFRKALGSDKFSRMVNGKLISEVLSRRGKKTVLTSEASA